jgi:hypothetical protein
MLPPVGAQGPADVPNRLTAAEKAGGWKLLFDGTTTAGWLEITGLPFPTTSWTIEDGCLKAFPNPDGQQDIRTAGNYRSFELQFDWKILKEGNSGVKYLVQKTSRWQRRGQKGFQARARGAEYQIVDDGTGEGIELNRTAGSLYSVIAPKPGAVKAPGNFNRSRLVVRGDHVEHWLNGVKVVEYEISQPEVTEMLQKYNDSSGTIARESPISLQNHGSPVWFRNLKVRPL